VCCGLRAAVAGGSDGRVEDGILGLIDGTGRMPVHARVDLVCAFVAVGRN